MSHDSSTSQVVSSADSRREEIRSVIAMSVPIVITMCSRMAMDVSDFIMITKLGDDAQAALLPAQVILWCYIVLGMGIVSIVSTFVSQCLGKGRLADCSAYTWQGIYLCAVFAVIGLGLRAVIPAVMAWIGHEPQIRQLELEYLRIAVLSIGPTLAAATLSNFFNGIHRPKVTMWSAIEGNVVNAVASLMLIFGLVGCPKLGIAGAAWGTVIGTSYRVVRLALTMCAASYEQSYSARRTWRPQRAKMLNVLRTGAPQGVQWVSDVVVWAVFINVLVGTYFGKIHLIATNVVWQYLRISFMPCLGIGIALTALVGKAVGEAKPDRAIRLTRISILAMMVYMGALSLVYFVGRSWFVSLFNDTPEIIAIGSKVLICAAVFQVFDGMGMGYNSALRGAGDTFWPSVMFVITHWLVLIGGGFAMVQWVPQWESVGPWIAATLLIILIGWLLWMRWHSRRWMTINIFKHEIEPAADKTGELTDDREPAGAAVSTPPASS